jgi:hypothetical protein
MEQLDLVYILRAGSRWRNNELRYSLRSIEENFESPGKVFIVGVCPRWVDTKNVTFIQEDDPYGDKVRNAIHKIKRACKDDRISERFILMNDDFYFMKKIRAIKLFNRGTLFQAKRDHKTKAGYYYKAISNTYEMLLNLGIKFPMDFEMHCPIVFEKKKFLRVADRIEGSNRTYLFRSVYYNLNEEKSWRHTDVKIYNTNDLGKYQNADIVSSSDAVATDPKFQRWLARKFKKESKYELKKGNMYYATETINYGGKIYNPGDLIIEELPPTVVAANKLRRVDRTP